MLTLTRPSRIAAGSLLLAMLGIELGGNYILDLVQGKAPATEFQQTFARAGHGHAGALATLGLTTIVLTDAAGLSGIRGHVARWAILIYIGAGALATGLVTLGGSLLSDGIRGAGSV